MFNGLSVSPHAISSIGNELGWAPYDTWSTVDGDGVGTPDGPHFAPAECPTTLQITDRWFIGREGFPIRPYTS